MFYWKAAKNIPSDYFFQNANRQLLLKIPTSICLEHQWMPLDGYGIVEKSVILSK